MTPAMNTGDFSACVELQRESIEAFRPDVVLGSSFGGAVVVELLRRGVWTGPTLLLAQAALKVCTFEFLFSGGPQMSDETFENFQKSHNSDYLVQFHRDYRAGFARDRIHAAVDAVDSDFQALEDRLSDGRTWLTGEDFTVADIAWIPNFHRMDLLRWPLDRYPYLSSWFQRASARDSYKTALESWEPQPLFAVALPILDARRASGDGIDNYGVRHTLRTHGNAKTEARRGQLPVTPEDIARTSST